jgi:predicted restriction endonuclease
MLDYGSISILDDLTVIGLDNAMIHTKHSLNKDNFKWHRDNIFVGNI